MVAPTIQNIWYESQAAIEPVVQLTIFQIGDVNCGLPIDKIHQIIGDGKNIDYLDDIEILDLHQQLLGVSSFDAIDDLKYWLIIKGLHGKFQGIPIELMPTFTSISLDRIRVIPEYLRAGTPLNIAAHVGMATDSGKDLMVFILEV